MAERDNEMDRIKGILRENPKGLTIEEVSKKLCLNRSTAAKYLNSLLMSGQAEMRALGPAKLFYLTRRLPILNMLSLSSDLIILIDADLFIQSVNDTALSRFGLSREELVPIRIDQSPLMAFFKEPYLDAIKYALEGHESAWEDSLPLGENRFFFKMKAIPLVFEEGERGAGFILEDITDSVAYQHTLEARVSERTRALEDANRALEKEIADHVRAEKDLEDARHFLQRIIETSPNLIYLYNLDTHDSRYVTPNITRILGFKPEELEKDLIDLIDLVHPEDRDRIRDLVPALQQTQPGEVVEFEDRMKSAGGPWIPLRNRIQVFSRDATGRVREILGTAEDITEQKRAREAANMAKKQIVLLNTVTRHDIINKLNALSGYLVATRKITDSREVLDLVAKETQIVNTIHRQISFTRDYQNLGIQEPQWVDVQAAIKNANKNIDTPHPPVTIKVDDLEIYADLLVEKVFYNLLDNAVRHGGSITTIRFFLEKRDEDMVIVCEDDGVGIPDADKEHIFDRSFGQNTGFGLFLAREILGITGLSIRENGVHGKGARFEIVIPRGAHRLAVKT